jgi:hypothetical protein
LQFKILAGLREETEKPCPLPRKQAAESHDGKEMDVSLQATALASASA